MQKYDYEYISRSLPSAVYFSSKTSTVLVTAV
jgi:hypothetical protein